MVRLKNPNETHYIAGFGEVNASNITEELYFRLVAYEKSLSQLFEIEGDIEDDDVGEESE